MAFLHMALSKTQCDKIVKQSLKNYDKQAANGFWEIKPESTRIGAIHTILLVYFLKTLNEN